MRRSLIAIFLLITSLASATKYYVSTAGTDGNYPNRGTFANPWKTWHYAFNNVTPGDTVYFRGGVYQPYSTTIGANLNTTAVDGTYDHPTCFFAYPEDWAVGNYPILDCTTMTVLSYNYGASISRCHNVYFKGLTIRNVKQNVSSTNNAYGWRIWNEFNNQYIPNNLRFENCVAHDIGGWGFAKEYSDSVYFINCDAYNCCDTISNSGDPGGSGNGFITGGGINSFTNSGNAYTYFYGCRAWKCSDQGFSIMAASTVIVDHCWAFRNGDTPFCKFYEGRWYGNGTTPCACETSPVNYCGDGKGSGFKLYYDDATDINKMVVQLTMKNCIAAYNAYRGINWCDDSHTNWGEVRAHTYNNFIYASGYADINWDAGRNVVDAIQTDTVGRYDHVWYNNVSYYAKKVTDNITGIINGSNNYFNVIGTPVTNQWFLSLDTLGMCGARKTDGSLPDTDFGKPAPNSPLIDAGIDVFGISYNGTAPDIGWAESSSASITPAAPAYTSSIIENTTPSRLEMTYNLALANVVPAASAFTVLVNSSTRSVSSVAISGTKVLLTLSSPIVYGDVVTVAYTKPATNPLQTADGGQAVSITAKSVTNNVTPVIPAYVNSVIENATPSRLEMTYNLTLANVVPTISAFSVLVNSSARTVTSAVISGTKILLTLASPVVYGDVVTVAYTKPATNPLQTAAGGQAESITAKSVTNNVTPVIPAYVSSVIENAIPSRLEMTYNLTLANVVPASSAFSVLVNSSARSVSSIAISDTKVLLTLASPVAYGDVVTVTYTKPATNPLQTASGGQAASLTAKSVTNNVATIIPAYVSSVIENATPARLEITYNLTLANVVSAASAFSVLVNSSARSVSSIAISGTKVLLTLTSPVVYGDAVTVAYTKPATNPLQTTSGDQTASFTAKSVTNNVAVAIPVYISSVVENATPSRIDITYNLTLANIVPATSAFAVTVNGSARTVSSVSVSGTKVMLTLANPVVNGNTVTVAYAKPALNSLQTAAGGQAVSFTDKSVTNNVATANQPPSIIISSPTKSTSFIAPATITIEAAASDPGGSIAKVEFYQGTVKLGELTSAPYSYSWKEVPEGTYSITVAATDNQNLRTVSTAVTVVVEKSPAQINQLPVVIITNPNKGKKFKSHDTIVIEAVASDPDGNVTKVELKSGNVIIAEMTSPPFIYTLSDVDTGTYQITAIATDNLGATSVSPTLALRVDDFYDGNSELVNLYPNPNEGRFIIDIMTDLPDQDNRMTIFSLSGKKVYIENIFNGDNPIEINMEGSAPGTYVLMINSGKTILATRKFILNK